MEAITTMISLQLADRQIKYPREVIEDVLVKVDKLYLPASLIWRKRGSTHYLRQTFLATNNTLIDVYQDELTLRVQDDAVTLNVFEAKKYPMDNEACF